jgi:hypothetical protein
MSASPEMRKEYGITYRGSISLLIVDTDQPKLAPCCLMMWLLLMMMIIAVIL